MDYNGKQNAGTYWGTAGYCSIYQEKREGRTGIEKILVPKTGTLGSMS